MALIGVKVDSREVRQRSGKSARTGREYSMRMQDVLVHHNGEVRKLEILLGDNDMPYEIGSYVIDPSELVQFGPYGFEISRNFKLKKAVQSAEKTAA